MTTARGDFFLGDTERPNWWRKTANPSNVLIQEHPSESSSPQQHSYPTLSRPELGSKVHDDANVVVVKHHEEEQQQTAMGMTSDQRNLIIIGLLVVLIIVLLIMLFYLLVPPFLNWLRRRRSARDQVDDEVRVQRRYETIEGWLISKRVRACDEECAKIQKAFCRRCCKPEVEDCSSPKSVELNRSFDSAGTENTSPSSDEEQGEDEKECPICMEPFAVGDIVSWSPNVGVACRHVFHHECIKEWMLQSGNCPCCRELILPIDEEGFALERPVLQELCKKRAKLACTTYYCQTDGLVCFDRRPATVTKKLAGMAREVTACRILPQDLTERRGDRVNAEEAEGDEGAEIDMSSVTESNHADDENPHSDEASNNNNHDGEDLSEAESEDGSTTLLLEEGRQAELSFPPTSPVPSPTSEGGRSGLLGEVRQVLGQIHCNDGSNNDHSSNTRDTDEFSI